MELSHAPHLVTRHRLIALSAFPAPRHLGVQSWGAGLRSEVSPSGVTLATAGNWKRVQMRASPPPSCATWLLSIYHKRTADQGGSEARLGAVVSRSGLISVAGVKLRRHGTGSGVGEGLRSPAQGLGGGSGMEAELRAPRLRARVDILYSWVRGSESEDGERVLTSFRWGTRRHHTWSQEEQANCRSTAGMRSSCARWNMRRLASVSGSREVATACGSGTRGGHTSRTNINTGQPSPLSRHVPSPAPVTPLPVVHGCPPLSPIDVLLPVSPPSPPPGPIPWTHLDVLVLLHVFWGVLGGDIRGRNWGCSSDLFLSLFGGRAPGSGGRVLAPHK